MYQLKLSVMKNKEIRNQLIKRTGVGFLILFAFFHCCEILGLGHIVELRYLNGVFLFFIIFSFMKYLKNNTDFKFLKMSFYGMLLGASLVLSFTLYITTYVHFINPKFFQDVLALEPFGDHLTKSSVPIIVSIESLAACVYFTFLGMQILKRKRI